MNTTKRFKDIDAGKILFILTNTLIYLFLLSPIIVVVFASLTNTEYVIFPPKGFTLKWYTSALERTDLMNSFKLSLSLASVVAIVSTTIGTMASYSIVRYKFKGREALNTFFLSPLMFPGIALGVALLLFFNTTGLIPRFLALFFGHVIVTTPFVIRSVSAVLYGFDMSLEEAAMDLGANKIITFFKITIPGIKGGLINGLLFSFVISFGNLVVSLFLAGPLFKTVPVWIYSYINLSSVDPTIAAVSSIIIIAELLIFAVLMKLTGSSDFW